MADRRIEYGFNGRLYLSKHIRGLAFPHELSLYDAETKTGGLFKEEVNLFLMFVDELTEKMLKGHCLIFLSAIYQLFIEYFNIK